MNNCVSDDGTRCKYIRDATKNGNLQRGFCHRYPGRIVIADTRAYWCGEYEEYISSETEIKSDRDKPISRTGGRK